jgi:hypothetical protein
MTFLKEQGGGAGGNWHGIGIMHDAGMRKNGKFIKLSVADRPASPAL